MTTSETKQAINAEIAKARASLDEVSAALVNIEALTASIPDEIAPPTPTPVPPEPTPEPPTPTPAPIVVSEYLGCPFTATSLGNIDCGGANKRHVFLPFISPVDGMAKTLTFYGVWAEGYGAGTGGTIEITLCESSGGQPGNTVPGGKIRHVNPKTQYGGRGKWSMPGTFSDPVGPLVKGKLYFVHFDNVAANDDANYIGVDILNHNSGYGEGSLFVKDALLACFYRSDTGAIKTHAQRVNNALDIGFVGGEHLSWPYMEVWLPGSNHWNAKIGSTQWSRQRITSTKDMNLTELTVAAKRISGSGKLIVELQTSGGTVLSSTAISSTVISPDKQIFCPEQKLAAPISVKAGTLYFVVLKTEANTTYTSYPLRCGAKSDGAYQPMVNGWAEWSLDSGKNWSGGWYGWDSAKRLKIADLPVCYR